jgi:mRNA guanylyltransferase
MPDSMSLIQKVKGMHAGSLTPIFQREVAELLGRQTSGFPGAQPVSFAGRHIKELMREDYWVCEKTDGIRYLMYMTVDEHGGDISYLIDRKNEYYFVPGLHFPHQDDPSFAKGHTKTILDGELVEDRPPNGPPVLKYLVFDCLVLDGNPLMHRSLDKRLAHFKSFVLKPYSEMFKKFPQEIANRPFVVEDKSTQLGYGLEMMFKQIIPSVKQLHGNDGLIFTCKNSPYQSGTDEHIIKWKAPEENTVDFLLHITWPPLDPDVDDSDHSWREDYEAFPESFDLYVYHGGTDYRHCGTMYVTPREWEQMKALGKPLQDSVVECYLDPVTDIVNGSANSVPNRRWRFYRIRDDKTDGNFHTIVDSVMESIEDHITEQDLLDAAPTIRAEWKKRQAEEERKQKMRNATDQQDKNS